MSCTEYVRVRIQPDLKHDAEAVLKQLGITPSQAMRMLYAGIVHEQGFPLNLKIPNEETLRAIQESEDDIDMVEASSARELFEKLGIEC
jgi:DNA-damage-inducible protein J